jgi:Histidine kinase-, DNA gyrase B-, and HSP90-like ATPase
LGRFNLMTQKLTSEITVDASPTKEFFIDILVRDIQLHFAIAELIDNSIDGAKQIRQSELKATADENGSDNKPFSGLYVHVVFDKNEFKITDNCGGISVETASKYAFKFGRTSSTPKVSRSIGQFGVGMKRALFKLGRFFEIESVAKDSSFLLKQDVDKWKQESNKDENGFEKWEFEFDKVQENQNNELEKCGTTIVVTNLNDSVKKELELKKFQNRLIELIENQQAESLAQGLTITINNYSLQTADFRLLTSNEIKPIYSVKKHTVKTKENRGIVKVSIFAGVGREAKLLDAGWYIFCNGRMVVKADKTNLTGWELKDFQDVANTEDSEKKGTSTPKAHYQFAHFRGFVYFESEDSTLLPWNTTKSNIDAESPVFQTTRLEMISALRQVIDFLNNLDKERRRGESFLANKMDEAAEASVGEITVRSANFKAPKSTFDPKKPETVKITYHKPTGEFDMVKKLLKANSAKEVGEQTFNFYLSIQKSTKAK